MLVAKGCRQRELSPQNVGIRGPSEILGEQDGSEDIDSDTNDENESPPGSHSISVILTKVQVVLIDSDRRVLFVKPRLVEADRLGLHGSLVNTRNGDGQFGIVLVHGPHLIRGDIQVVLSTGLQGH